MENTDEKLYESAGQRRVSVERDMRAYKTEDKPSGDAFQLADYVLKKYPLVGEYIPTPEEEALLYERARKTVEEKILRESAFNFGDAAALVVETVQQLKDWSSLSAKAGKQDAFWNYIFGLYGFNVERFGSAEKSRIYEKFRMAIDRVFQEKYHRFTASEGQRYYTTLLLHALAPRHSVENFLDILYDFYVKNLDCQYVREDTSYEAFTRGMRARWSEETSETKLRSLEVLAGLKTLFIERPGFMTALSEKLVRKMDAMLRGEGYLDTEGNYWDYLLSEWRRDKGIKETPKKPAEYVAVSRERIFTRYAMVKLYGEEEFSVGLSLPKIRLPETEYENPAVRIYQGERRLYEGNLSVQGNDLCLTTQSRFFPLKEIGYDFSAPPQMRVEIDYLNANLYRSGERVWRDYVTFDDDGNEQRALKSGTPGTVWLFAGSQAAVAFDNESGAYQAPHPGQLYRVNLGEVSAVTVDGQEIFASETTVSRFRCYPSAPPLRHARAIIDGKICRIFPAPVTLSVRLPEGEDAARYRLSMDGRTESAERYRREGNELLLSPPDFPETVRRLRITDSLSDSVKFECRYIILPRCDVRTAKPLYREGIDETDVTFSWDGGEASLSFPPLSGADSVTFSPPGLNVQIEADIPLVRGEFMEGNLFAAPNALWYQRIPQDEFVKLRLPDGWEGRLMLDGAEIPKSPNGQRFELGNALRSGGVHRETEALWVMFKDAGGAVEKYKITDVVFRPRFQNGPLRYADKGLLWRAEDNFIGDAKSEFSVSITGPDGQERRFKTGLSDALLTDEALPEGLYRYQVFLKPRSVFAAGTGELIYEGGFPVGDENLFRFIGKELPLHEAIYWDFDKEGLETVALQPESGVLRDLAYQGVSAPYDEELPAPCYTATLYYADSRGQRRPFAAEASKNFDPINPVSVWIISQRLLILKDASDGAPYIDKQSSKIFKWKPDILSRAEQYQRLENPDYFSYQIREA